MTVSKRTIDLQVAAELDMSQRTVTKATTRFLERVKSELVKNGEVYLQGFGRFKVVQYTTSTKNLTKLAEKRSVEQPPHFKVFFAKAPALRSALKRKHR